MVMTVLLTGWSGTALAASREWSPVGGADVPPTHHPGPEVTYTLTRDRDCGGVRLGAAGAAIDVEKTVRPDGCTDASIRSDRLGPVAWVRSGAAASPRSSSDMSNADVSASYTST